jgi:hypothetical protein
MSILFSLVLQGNRNKVVPSHSRIDFILGDEQIPLEVEFIGNSKSIGTCMREGTSHVREFMEHHHVANGIVVIGDPNTE